MALVDRPKIPSLPEGEGARYSPPSGGLESIKKESSIKKDPESFFKAVIFGPKETEKKPKTGPGAKPKRATPGDLFSGYKPGGKEKKAKTPEKPGALFSKKQTSKERWKVRESWRQKEYSEYFKHMPPDKRTKREFVKWLEQDLVKLGQKYISRENLDKAIRKLDKERWKVAPGKERTLMEKKLEIYQKMKGLTK